MFERLILFIAAFGLSDLFVENKSFTFKVIYYTILLLYIPIVSILNPGTVKIGGRISLPEETAHHFNQQGEDTFLDLPNGGTLEMQQNKVVLLAD